MEKKKLLVSFSGGETSAYMAWWLWNYKRDEYDMVFVFANTGQENEETLEFIQDCSLAFGFHVIWIEAVVYHGERKGNSFRVVDFNSADREGKVFEEMIRKHGIPNVGTPHCTRELKQVPIRAFAKSLGWTDYYTAIGIREDEADRISAKAKENRIIYPLINKDMRPMTKKKINFWWSMQPFRLELKGYQGNCKTCWKKSDKKLFQIAKESPEKFDFNKRMEELYSGYVPESRLVRMRARGEEPNLPTTFFRRNRTTAQLLEEAEGFDGEVINDAEQYDLVGGDSCEVFSECNDESDPDKIPLDA